MTQEALKLALEALERFEGNKKLWPEAITAIKEALAQTQEPLIGCVNHDCDKCKAQTQEPVAWQLWVGADTPLNAPMGWHFYSTYDSLKSAEVSARTINSYQQAPFAKVVPLYTAPPQRTWVGLTDEEIARVVSLAGFSPDWVEAHIATQIVRVLEAKLKQKNT